MTDTAKPPASSDAGVSVDRPVHNHAPYHPVCKESLIGDCLRQPSLDREAVRPDLTEWSIVASRSWLLERLDRSPAAHPEAERGEDEHNEGSCALCTGQHDAEEAAHMNRRRQP